MFDPRGLIVLVIIFMACMVGAGWFGHDIFNWLHDHLAVSWK